MSSDRHDAVFKALASTSRRAMLDLLRTRPRTTGELTDHLPKLDRCTVMQHLAVLEKAGLVIGKRSGRHRWNYLDPTPIREIHDRWINRYAGSAVSLLARLRRDLSEADG